MKQKKNGDKVMRKSNQKGNNALQIIERDLFSLSCLIKIRIKLVRIINLYINNDMLAKKKFFNNRFE